MNTCYITSAYPYRGSFKIEQACSNFSDPYTRYSEIEHACSIFYKAYISQSHTLLFTLSCAMVF